MDYRTVFTLLRRSAEPAHTTEAHERPQAKGAAPVGLPTTCTVPQLSVAPPLVQ